MTWKRLLQVPQLRQFFRCMLHFASTLVRSLTPKNNTCNDPGLGSNPAQKSPHFLALGLQTSAPQNYCSNPDPHYDEHTENRQLRDLVLIYHQTSSFATEKPAKKGLLMKACKVMKGLMLFVFIHFCPNVF